MLYLQPKRHQHPCKKEPETIHRGQNFRKSCHVEASSFALPLFGNLHIRRHLCQHTEKKIEARTHAAQSRVGISEALSWDVLPCKPVIRGALTLGACASSGICGSSDK